MAQYRGALPLSAAVEIGCGRASISIAAQLDISVQDARKRVPGVGDVGTVVECAEKYRTDLNADFVIIP